MNVLFIIKRILFFLPSKLLTKNFKRKIKKVFTNIDTFGLSVTLIWRFYEIIYCLNPTYFKHTFFDESMIDKYERSDKTKEYNSPYVAVPIYFLRIVNSFLKKYNLKNFTFIDFGSGAGRSLVFFRKSFKDVYGIEFYEKFKKFYQKNEFILCDLREKNNFLFFKKNNENFILFFFDPFDQELVEKILSCFENENYITILINYKELKNNSCRKIFEKRFKKELRNIRVYTNISKEDFEKLK